MTARSSARAAAIAATLALAGCKRTGETKAPDAGESARRTAQSFVHCVEQGGSVCVDTGARLGAWDAFSLLGWLATGSPISILQALPRELEHHKEARNIQRRFVDLVDRQREPLRGSECRAERSDPLDAMVPKLREVAQTRMTGLGLRTSELEAVVAGLSKEAGDGLRGGYLVSMRCQGEPWELYVATTTQEERQVVIGVMTRLPPVLGGTAPSRDSRTGRLAGVSIGDAGQLDIVSEGVVDRWVPVPVEVF
jgi:hypothetical protein